MNINIEIFYRLQLQSLSNFINSPAIISSLMGVMGVVADVVVSPLLVMTMAVVVAVMVAVASTFKPVDKLNF